MEKLKRPSTKIKSRPIKNDRVTINIRYTFNRKITYIGTGVKIESKYWNDKEVKVKDTVKEGHPHAKQLNQQIRNKYNQVFEIAERIINEGGTPETEKVINQLKGNYNEAVKKSNEMINKPFREAYKQYYSLIDDEGNEVKHKDLTGKQIKYKQYMNRVNDYLNTSTGKAYVNATVNEWIKDSSILQGLINYLKPKYSAKVVRNQVNPIKHVLNKAKELSEKGFTAVDIPKIPSAENEPIIWLTDEEINQLASFEFKNKSLERVVDSFLILCSTSARYSEYETIRWDSKNVIYKSKKTGKEHTIRRFWFFDKIVKKYNGKLPHIPANQNYNPMLKKAFMIAELDNPKHTKQGIMPLHEAITSHVGRKTCIMKLLRFVDIETISKITDTNIRTLKTYYLRYEKEEALKKMDSIIVQMNGENQMKIAK